MSEAPPPLISVVICTYNRADLLADVLRTLVCQTLSPDRFEIIIVDNNSKDATQGVCSSIIAENPDLPIRYVLEPRQGLSHARNRGWREARGEYVGYVDDDCRVPPEWLENAEEVVKRVQPTAFGGPYYAFYTSPKPAWFKKEYCTHVQGSEARPLQDGEYLDGANIFIRKNILKTLDGFNPDLGMSGDKIAYGEETALLLNIRKKILGALIYYDPKLHVYHLVPPQKMLLSWNARSRFINGRYASRVFNSRNSQNKNVIKKFLHGVVLIGILVLYLTIGTIFRDRSRYPCFQNYYYERSFQYIEGLGACWGYIFEN